jgi:aminomethyltransferase
MNRAKTIPDASQADVRQCDSVDQSDRRVPINLRQSGPTPVGLLISTRVRKSPYWHLSMEAG